MKSKTTREYLTQLHNTILSERELARSMNIEGLTDAMKKKEELLQVLAHIGIIDDKDRDLAASIRLENRRNAFLFKSTLGWIRQTMEFFGQRTVTSTYSSNAYTVDSQVNGRLLSGRI